jgi:hypothetical protein
MGMFFIGREPLINTDTIEKNHYFSGPSDTTEG